LVVAPLTLVALGLNLSGDLANAIGDHPWLAAFAQFLVTVVVPLVLLFGVLLLLFRVLPDAGSSLRVAWPGALVALIGVVAISYGTELYFAIFGDANAVYGTMGALWRSCSRPTWDRSRSSRVHTSARRSPSSNRITMRRATWRS
jgi:uncharacterized BrkB/YihY/UPF0761 family membrane protein